MLMLIFIMFSHLNICDVRGHSFGTGCTPY